MDANQRLVAVITVICFIAGYWIVSAVLGKKRAKRPIRAAQGSLTECLFCSRPLEGNRAQEQVLSSWLLRYLDLVEQETATSDATSTDVELIARQGHSSGALLEAGICSGCSAGWMSQLDHEAKPILLPLINGSRSVFGLSDRERLILSRWAAKTGYMLNSTSNSPDYVDPKHLRDLSTDAAHLPSGAAVFVQQHGLPDVSTRRFSCVEQNHWPNLPLRGSGEYEEHTGDGGYKIGLQIDKLLLLIAYWPYPAWQFAPVAGMHIPLWPLLRTARAYTLNETVPANDSFLFLMAFTRSLAVTEVRRHTLFGGWAVVRR